MHGGGSRAVTDHPGPAGTVPAMDLHAILAAHPATPIPVLEHLAGTVLAAHRPGVTYGPHLDLARVLATNPRTPATAVRALCKVAPEAAALSYRPDTGAAAVATTLTGVRTAKPWIEAVWACPDPDATLAEAALAHNTSTRLLQALTEAPRTAIRARVRAACLLVAQAPTTRPDRDLAASDATRIAAVAATSADAAHRIRAAATERVWTQITAALDALGPDVWFCSATTAQVLDHLAGQPADRWAAALDHHTDPTGALAAAAFDAHPDDDAVRRRVITSVSTPAPIAHRAIVRHHATLGALAGDALRAERRLVESAPGEVLTTLAELPGLETHVWYAVARSTDVRPAALDGLTARASSASTRVWAPLASGSISAAPVWAAVVATHPAASLRQRQEALDATGEPWQSATPGRYARVRDPGQDQLVHVARIGLQIPALGLAGAGGLLPAATWSMFALVPTLATLAHAAVSDLAPALGGDPAAWKTLWDLAPTFTGTLADLFHVAAAIAA